MSRDIWWGPHTSSVVTIKNCLMGSPKQGPWPCGTWDSVGTFCGKLHTTSWVGEETGRVRISEESQQKYSSLNLTLTSFLPFSPSRRPRPAKLLNLSWNAISFEKHFEIPALTPPHFQHLGATSPSDLSHCLTGYSPLRSYSVYLIFSLDGTSFEGRIYSFIL